MHKYLRAIGFSKIKNRLQFDRFYKDAITYPDHRSIASTGLGSSCVQYDKKFGKYIGISVVGEIDMTGEIFFEHYFPFILPTAYRRDEECRVEKHCYNESYDGIFEDIGMSVVFYVQNIADYNRYVWYKKKHTIHGFHLSALSNEGRILLPLATSREALEAYDQDIENSYELLEQAKKGDANANEELILKNVMEKNEADKRLQSEDVFTIVKSSLIPYGIECEAYDMTGTILRVGQDVNTATEEEVYMLLIRCNELIINLCINKLDLEGIPVVGRRFKGIIWLQGYLPANEMDENA